MESWVFTSSILSQQPPTQLYEPLQNYASHESKGEGADLAAAFILAGVDVEEVVLLCAGGNEEVDEAHRADDGVHDAEHQAQQDCDGVLWQLQGTKTQKASGLFEQYSKT